MIRVSPFRGHLARSPMRGVAVDLTGSVLEGNDYFFRLHREVNGLHEDEDH